MVIGILNTDTIKPEFAKKYGQYPQMFSNILSKVSPDIEIVSYEVQSNQYPKDLDECAGYLITGSKADAYGNLPWLETLKDFIQTLDRYQKKLVGICFGHQVVAEALGGKTAKSKKGWHVGVDTLLLKKPIRSYDPSNQTINLIFNHQDEVTEMPPGAELLAHTANHPIGIMKLGNHILTIQGHIEFSQSYAKDLLDMRKDILGDELYDEAYASMQIPTDEIKTAEWILDFFKN